MLLKICIKSENLSVILEPWGLHSWNIIILWSFSFFQESQLGDTFGELVDEILINFFFGILFFLLIRAINEIELLRFVEVLFIWIVKDMSWKERDLLWYVCLHIYRVKIISYIY